MPRWTTCLLTWDAKEDNMSAYMRWRGGQHVCLHEMPRWTICLLTWDAEVDNMSAYMRCQGGQHVCLHEMQKWTTCLLTWDAKVDNMSVFCLHEMSSQIKTISGAGPFNGFHHNYLTSELAYVCLQKKPVLLLIWFGRLHRNMWQMGEVIILLIASP